ncbi:hypothetical protein [Aurantimonas sp. 22II-16-19i]|uniref:hypothetical protein n=1 Tax=Aurantimonas sp. 22II-16-19i TaxID=1317114 RepID=UPI0009F8022A|nr:hypothetical protein [Aurantimonas sp. 22II-16-19i]ORE93848.1 hypothetical protein ATO4_15696 [Aurantimonas sp. 22II-16-19i]
MARKLASIIVFAAHIEYHLERALWVLEEIDPRGIRPTTDAKPISELIAMLASHAAGIADEKVRGLLETWCHAARSGFSLRHDIAHGVSLKMQTTLFFLRNPRWQGEVRKREFSKFHCDVSILEMIRASMATLLRIIGTISENKTRLADIANPLALSALREARSTLGEFADRFYNPTFEKY